MKQFEFKTKTFTKKLKRLFNGKLADARDYEVERCKNLGLNIRFEVEGVGTQVFHPEDGVILNNKAFVSKRGTAPYKLVSFFWRTEKSDAGNTKCEQHPELAFN
jgi:ATP-dependent phosphoenolpyruvate carboxykinase